ALHDALPITPVNTISFSLGRRSDTPRRLFCHTPVSTISPDTLSPIALAKGISQWVEPRLCAVTDIPDRRARRRAETLEEIMDISLQVMSEPGVAGLRLSAVARRLGVRPPSLYKYFPSRNAVYDALFRRGQQAYLEAVRQGAAGHEPGMAAM